MKKILNYSAWKTHMFRKAMRYYQTVRLPHGTVSYSDIGTGPKVLYFHGSFGGLDSGPLFLQELADKGFRIITPSRPGFMFTHMHLGGTPEKQAEMFLAFIDALKIDKVKVLAHSGGVPTAAYFASKYPERVESVIFLTPVAHKVKFGYGKILNKVVYNDFIIWIGYLLSVLFPVLYVHFACRSLGISSKYILENETRTEHFKYSFESASPALHRYDGASNDMLQFETIDLSFLRTLKTKCLVMYSESDERVPTTHGDYLADNLHNRVVYKFEKGGHNPILGAQSSAIVNKMIIFFNKNR